MRVTFYVRWERPCGKMLHFNEGHLNFHIVAFLMQRRDEGKDILNLINDNKIGIDPGLALKLRKIRGRYGVRLGHAFSSDLRLCLGDRIVVFSQRGIPDQLLGREIVKVGQLLKESRVGSDWPVLLYLEGIILS